MKDSCRKFTSIPEDGKNEVLYPLPDIKQIFLQVSLPKAKGLLMKESNFDFVECYRITVFI